jgi:hypothetical protein
MQTVMKNFIVYRWIEIIFIIIALLLIFLFKSNPDKSFWSGFGVALAILATIMLGADYFAEKRSKIYFNELRKMV